MTSATQTSHYFDFLPEVFREDAALNGFLLAFEKMLNGPGEVLDGMDRYFDPQKTPLEFLNWLAGWVALTSREDWDESTKREFLQNIVPLYRKRGTKAGLEKMLQIYTRLDVQIHDHHRPLQIGVTSTVGVDTILGSSTPHYFLVELSMDVLNPLDYSRNRQIARAIIDQEKPAHTYYDLRIFVPTMQIGVTSTIGRDTFLGTQEVNH